MFRSFSWSSISLKTSSLMKSVTTTLTLRPVESATKRQDVGLELHFTANVTFTCRKLLCTYFFSHLLQFFLGPAHDDHVHSSLSQLAKATTRSVSGSRCVNLNKCVDSRRVWLAYCKRIGSSYALWPASHHWNDQALISVSAQKISQSQWICFISPPCIRQIQMSIMYLFIPTLF